MSTWARGAQMWQHCLQDQLSSKQEGKSDWHGWCRVVLKEQGDEHMGQRSSDVAALLAGSAV